MKNQLRSKMNFEKLKSKLINDDENKKIVGLCIYVLLGVVALFMTVMNIATDKGFLTWATGAFTLLCVTNVVLVLNGKTCMKIAAGLFSVEIIALFTYFLISGQPDGFSIMWICMLPSLGMIFFGRKKGSAICGIMLLDLILLLWIPAGNALLKYDYTETFKMRFPVLFIAIYLCAFFLETLRMFTYDEMRQMQKLYKGLSIRDQLTAIYNRQGMYSAVEHYGKKNDFSKMGVAVMDIDFFKSVNDTYGHTAGDEVLKGVADLIKENLDTIVCRWGGEEFSVVFFDGKLKNEDFENFRRAVEEHVFEFGENRIRITISIGVYENVETDTAQLNPYLRKADSALYEAKRSGRNRVVYCRAEDSAEENK